MTAHSFSINVINSETVKAIAYSRKNKTLAVLFPGGYGQMFYGIRSETFSQLTTSSTQALDVWNLIDPHCESSLMPDTLLVSLLSAIA